jgi:dihydrofolate reductase
VFSVPNDRHVASIEPHRMHSTESHLIHPVTTFNRCISKPLRRFEQHSQARKQRVLPSSQPGKDIYLVGGARTTASFIDAGLVDELRLIVYPLIAGEGKALFATTERRCGLELRKVQQLTDGRVSLIYGIG